MFDSDVVEESGRTREDRIDAASGRSPADVLSDIYSGRSDLGADALIELIFQGARREFLGQLDQANEDLAILSGLEARLLGSSVAVTTGLSVGYVLWLTRGGLLIASLLTSLPAWRLIDPVPILAHLGPDDGEDESESLDSLVQAGADADESDDDDPSDATQNAENRESA